MHPIAGHTMGTPGMSVPEALRLFKDVGLDAAEIVWQDGYDCGIPEDDGGRTLATVDRARRELGLAVCALTPYMNALNSTDEVARQRDLARFRACIADAARLEAGRIRVYAGSFRDGEDDPDGQKWSLLLASLREIGAEAARQGVILVVEDHFNTMAASAARAARLMSDLAGAPGVGILYDQANLTFTHQETYTEAIALQARWIRHVHVKDLVFVDPNAPFRASAVERVGAGERNVRSRVVGEGVLDWMGILRALDAAGYDGALSLEYEYRWHPQDLPEPREGFRRSAEHIRRLLREAAA